ncbi:MAG: hypothetical protein J0H68_03640 [Sphingobacteriia bacterium]|nr:hypothetical protein [Sphingobacteriia bacterium]
MTKYNLNSSSFFNIIENSKNQNVNMVYEGTVHRITDQNGKHFLLTCKMGIDENIPLVGDERDGFEDEKYIIKSEFKDHMKITNKGVVFCEYFYKENDFDDSHVLEMITKINSQTEEANFMEGCKQLALTFISDWTFE